MMKLVRIIQDYQGKRNTYRISVVVNMRAFLEPDVNLARHEMINVTGKRMSVLTQ